jgi:DNA-binding response OmpR family regulator
MQALVVDDSAAMRRILQKALEQLGWSVSTASGTVEAILRLQENVYDVLVTDWHMPDGTGLDLARHVRETQTSAQLKIVMVTSESTHEALTTALSSGVDDFIMKPFDTATIQERMTEVMAEGG